ncbi:Tol-Pal system peptidoglycan-associated lipoprotein PAL [Citrifermentans bremense]|uniref:Peptidoglycan-associated lipoprotein n=1 Tax=Citrifermentans bremense TaxID=60035 RepID=A0A6S6M4I9_9BACT|nr:peptidoglycan-associated lipoprotein Pal [Citrifermentans bremense]BCG46571.1 Tol-Pal system peptidoglycan-associated lipoprotein PAL [Citrifermentans bremense]
MKRKVLALVVLGFVAIGVSGCAKHEMVKAEPPIVPLEAVAKPPVKAEATLTQVAAPLKIQPTQINDESLPTPLPAQLEPISQAGELKVSLQEIYFDFDSSSLSKDARETLVKNADILKKAPDIKIQIAGHCDERGSDEYNLALGEKRAKAARNYLTELGIPTDRLSVISYGEERPVDPGHNTTAWAANRHDEFVVSEK